MNATEAIGLGAKWDQVDAARERLRSMRLVPFEYTKPKGTKKHEVKTFYRMVRLLDEIAYLIIFEGRRDFTTEEVAKISQCSTATIERAISDCVGRGLLKASCAQEGTNQPPPGHRRFEIQWNQVDMANPDFQRDEW